LRARFGARLEALQELPPATEASLPGGAVAGRQTWNRAEITVSWPLEAIGCNLPNIVATVAGNLFELREFSGLRLLDLSFPVQLTEHYSGPQFGINGTRRLAGVDRRPLIGTIIKPSIGLSPDDTAALVQQLCDAGIDFIKDDELQGDGPACPLRARVRAVMRVILAHAERTGRKVMYAFNITGELDAMQRHHDLVRDAGGTCVMVSLNSCGLVGFSAFRRHSELPIHAHRNGWGYLSRSPGLGFSYIAWQKFWRLAGADHMHVNGLRNKFCESDESVIASAQACLTPMFPPPAHGCEVIPVFSSGQWAGQAPDTYRLLGSSDLIYACGGGIMAHPGGVAAGVTAIREAWEAAMSGVALEEFAKTHVALAQALANYG
jgi:ribulose-bisphosphate carboxylase large chain